MGNHHGNHRPHSKSGDSTPASNGSRKNSARKESIAEPEETPSQLLPVEKLTEVSKYLLSYR